MRALLTEAAGGTIKDAAATAALEAAAGQYSRAFQVAEVTPANSTATMALTPAVLGLMARDLIRRGEFVHVIAVERGGVRLQPAGSMGRTRRFLGPADVALSLRPVRPQSGNITRHLPAAAVVHGRFSIDPARPWYGVGPLGWAALTGRLHGALEGSLADEAAGPVGSVIPVPQSPDDTPDTDDPDDDTDPLAKLRADVAALRGKTALVETVAAGWGEGQTAAPHADWRPQRIGAAPPDSLPVLRSDSAVAVLAAAGVPADLAFSADSTGQQEAWRRFLHGSVQPLADLLSVELADKLDVADLRLTFDGLRASDVGQRARAYAALVKADMDKTEAGPYRGADVGCSAMRRWLPWYGSHRLTGSTRLTTASWAGRCGECRICRSSSTGNGCAAPSRMRST